MSGSGSPPVVHRPIPRRPFSIKTTNPTAAPDDAGSSRDSAPAAQQNHDAPSLPRFLERQVQQHADSDGSADMSRTQSIRNLTASTLFGIFNPIVLSGSPAGAGDGASFDEGTPWGAGSETPATKLQGDDEATGSSDGGDRRTAATDADLDEVRRASRSLMMLQSQQKRASGTTLAPAGGRRGGGGTGRASSRTVPGATAASPPSSSRVFFLVSTVGRAVLLFLLGMGYGALVTRLRSETTPPTAFDDLSGSGGGVVVPRYDAISDWRYLISWGVSGVVLGTLLPWFDGVWERAFGSGGHALLGNKGRAAPETDWALVVRGIGAFAGVVFAMRKLAWTSSMQASLTLALANPFLWYLLDRSKSGLLLSAAFCFLGTGVLAALDLDLLPNPGLTRSHQTAAAYGGGAGMGGGALCPSQNDSHRMLSSAAGAAAAGSGASGGAHHNAAPAVTAETAIWMLSVLFCSCVCFGSIGRRLALQVPAPAVQRRP